MTNDKKSKPSEMNKNPAGNTRLVKGRKLNEGLQCSVRAEEERFVREGLVREERVRVGNDKKKKRAHKTVGTNKKT